MGKNNNKKGTFPIKFMFPGLVTFFLFMLLPIVFTVLISFTNLGTGHLLNFDDALEILKQEKFTPAQAKEYPLVVYLEKNFITVETIFKKQIYSARINIHQAPIAPHYLAKDIVHYGKKLSRSQVFNQRQKLKGHTFILPNEVKLQYFRSNILLTRKFKYITQFQNQIKDMQTEIVYTPDFSAGYFKNGNLKLIPGFYVNIGLKNFTSVLFDKSLHQSLSKILSWTFIWSVVSVALTFVFGLLFALLLNNKNLKLKAIYRVFFIIPYSIPFFISVLVFKGLLNKDFGAINALLADIGIGSVPWLSDPFWAKVSCLLVNLWLGFPYMLLVITGILQAIPGTIYEAAKLDGAGPFATLTKITLPLIMQAIIPLLVGSFAFNLNNFVGIYLLTGGGPPMANAITPAGETDILISYTYRLAFEGGQGQNFGLASSMAIYIFLIICVITIINFKFSGMLKNTEESSS